jgi:arylsulfatase A
MRTTILLLAAVLLCNLGGAETRPPNIVFILADDLGYGEIGAYGQEKIRTPSLDKLASEGMRFTRHYAGSPVCAPSRCVLMTGLHPGHAWVRNNREVKPEGQFPLPADAVTIAKLLKERGYVTGAFGKWGLGGPDSTGEPLKQGFDRFYGYNCQRVAHSFYPQSLWDDDRVVKLDNPPMEMKSRLPADADPNSSASYAAFAGKDYSADLIADQALRFVRDNSEAPFFLYWPTTVPHLALQVPEDSLAEYLGKWPDPPYTGGRGYLPHFAPRAAYAAMITRMDREIGRLLELLGELGLADDTIVVFTSDNGPAYDGIGGTDTEFFRSAGGLRGLKGSLYEGGIRVPLIVRWNGRIAPGSLSDHVTGFEDWLPTLLELAGLGKGPALDGISFAPTLLGNSQPERGFLYREFPAYGGQQSVWMGDWKLIRRELMPQRGSETSPTLELFNLKNDPAEKADVASANPEVVARLMEIMRAERTPSEHFPFPALDRETTQTAHRERRVSR